MLLHEFGHSLAARRYGIKTPDITLLPIGGVARLERMPSDPKQELVIAIAGPMVNVVIAAVLFIFLQTGSLIQPLSLETQSVGGFLANLMVINVYLVLFNLVPAFPMDGGRILRALLAMRFPYAKATAIAAGIGQALAFVGGFLGFIIPAPLLIFIALFVFLGAGAEASAARIQEATRGTKVAHAMMTDIQLLQLTDRISQAVDYLLEGAQTDFPVVDEEGRPAGMVQRKDLISALREHGETANIGVAISDCEQTVQSDDSLTEVMQQLNQSQCRSFPVLDTDGKVVGLLTMENIGEWLMIRSALDSRQDPQDRQYSFEAGQKLIDR